MQKLKLYAKRVLSVPLLLGVGYLIGTLDWSQPNAALGRPGQEGGKTAAAAPAKTGGAVKHPSGSTHLLQSPGAVADRPETDWGLGDGYVDKLLAYPKPCPPGMRTPFDLWRYAGKGASSFGSPDLHMPWADWVKMCEEQKPRLMAECLEYMQGRFDFHGKAIEGATQSGGKPIMLGPAARLPKGVASFEALAAMSPGEIKEKDLFPYKPLAHPLQTTAHMLFPEQWLASHPEHQRIDCDFDIPDDYLPEFPPPMFLTTHKELGDVTNGREVTIGNYYEIFNGLLTGEQMEGLKELLRPTATTWFNHTDHRVTEEPSAGVACFSCHVNGHTNGAIELAPDSRPNQARLRIDTPTMRGNYNLMQLSSKRSIRSMDHFAEVEEYFDGDPGELMQPIGLRRVSGRSPTAWATSTPSSTSRRPRSSAPLMRLYPEKATAAGAARRGAVPRQGPVRQVPLRAGVRGRLHARPAGRAVLRRPAGGADQDVPAARHQGHAARTCTTAAARRCTTPSSSSTSCWS